jgi:hypothetical protein
MLLARRLMAAWLLRLSSALRAPLRRIVAGLPPPPPAPPPPQPLAVPLLSIVPFTPPNWAQSLRAPSERIVLGHMPTPLMPWACPELQELGVRWVIKRDDMTGMELSGNKVRAARAKKSFPSARDADALLNQPPHVAPAAGRDRKPGTRRARQAGGK